MRRELLLLVALPLLAQQRALKVYTSADGLGHNRVYRIVSDSKGFLWFCTFDGLTRFDGQHFLNFSSATGAPFITATDLVEIPGGDYWIASRGQGLIRFFANGPLEPVTPGKSTFQHYPIGNDAASNDANVLLRDRSGVLWIGTNGGIYCLREQKSGPEIRPVTLGVPGHSDRDIQVFGMTEDPEGAVYAATNFGVLSFLPDGRRVFYRFLPGYRPDEVGPVVFQDGVLWLGQPGGVFLLRPAPANAGPNLQVDDAFPRAVEFPSAAQFTIPRQPGQAVCIRLHSDPPRNYVFAIHKLLDGRIWVASQGGMFEFNGGELRPILRDVPFNFTLEIGQDSAENMWLSTDGLGVAKIESRGSASFTQADGLGAIPVGVMIDHAGNLLVSNWPRQIAILSGERFQRFDLKLSPKADFTGYFASLLQDHLDEWWVATSGGLYRFPKLSRPQDWANVSPKAVLTRKDGLGDDEVWSPFEDSAGDIWVAGRRSTEPIISRWERSTGRIYRYSTNEGLPAGADRLVGIVEDREKSVWFAFSEGGLARYRDGRFRSFGEAQGLDSAKIAGIAVDPRGRVWCSIVGHGLARIDDESGDRLKLQTYSMGSGSDRLGGPVYSDPQGRIYHGLMHGVDRLDPSNGVITHYGAADGVPDGPIYMITGDRKGAIWINSRKFVVRILPDAARETHPNPVLISALRVSGVDYRLPPTGARSLGLHELPYQKNSLEIDFLSLSFAPGQAPLFQYTLDGADHEWSPATTLGTVNYANLAPGNYRFQVRQVSRGEDSAGAPAELTFRILQPLWKQNWFIALTLLLILGGLAGFERYRAARMRQLRSAMAALRTANEALDIESAISRILAQATDEKAFPSLLETVCQRTGWTRAAFWQRDRQSALLHRAAEWPPDGTAPAILLPGQELASKAVEAGYPRWISEPAGHACFPILMGESVLAVIELQAEGPRDLEPSHAETISSVAGMIGQWMERLRAERALRASEESFRTLAETASDAILTINEQGTILFCNSSAADVFGYAASDMIGQDLTMLMPPRLREAHRHGFGRYLRTGERRMSWRAAELPGLHADGREMSLELSFGEFRRDEKRFFTAVVRDVTERKRTEEALRRSREERIAEIERVRRRIAVDLHDDIGSSLTQISVLSEVARRQVPGSSTLERPLEIIAGSSRELIDSMSDIVWAINPQRDHLADLVHRMRRFAADTLTARNIEFTIELPGEAEDIKLEGNLRREVFLIFKEALNNAVRHSGCTRAEIELRLEDHSLRLHLRDNGKGFDSARTADGHGLMSMSSRASGIGGRFAIASEPGQGSAITLEVPLNPT